MLTYAEIELMIDDYISDSNNIDPKWAEALLILRNLRAENQQLRLALQESCIFLQNFKDEKITLGVDNHS